MKHFTKVAVCFVITFLTTAWAFAAVPIFSQKQINSLAATSFTLTVQIDQAGTLYYVVTTSATPPSQAQVKAGQDNTGSAAFKSGSFPLLANTTANQNITGLASQTQYYIYFIAENGGAEQTPVQTLTATTLDNTPPSFNSSSIQNNTTGNSFDLRVNVSEIATTYYVVTLSGTTPTAAQVKLGQDNSGSAAFKSGNFPVPASTNTSGSITGLASGTLYHIYFIAEDAATPTPNQSGVQSLTATTPSVPAFNSSSISAITFTGFTLNVNVNTNATLYFVVTQSATPPSVTQIKAGQNQVGGTPDAGGNYAVVANTGNAHPIGSLSGATLYYCYFVAESVLTSAVQTLSATTKDNVPPSLSSFTPVDGATNVATTTKLVLTFNKPVIISSSGAAAGSDEIHVNGIDIPRGSGGISIASNVVTVTIPSTLALFTDYTVTIGDDVFSNVDGTDYPGISSGTTWNFKTNAGATVTPTTGSFCPNKFTSLGNIVLSEVAVDNFHGTAGATRTIILQLDPGFAFQPISPPGINIPFTAGRDINTAKITSASFNTATISINFTGGNVTDQLDQITIQGLKVIYDGSSAQPIHLIKSGGDLTLDLDFPAPAYWATLGSASPEVAPTLVTADIKYCQGENIAAAMASVTPIAGGSYTWYSDQALTTVVSNGAAASVNVTSLGISSAAAGPFTRYVTQATSSTCEGPALTVDFAVTPLPVANAGADSVGVDAVCSKEPPIALGGSPTLQSPSIPGAYTYAWVSSPVLAIPAEANPEVSVTNSTGSNVSYSFTVTITDANGCQGVDTKLVDVRPAIVPVLVQPSSTTFSTNSAAQLLAATPTGGTFSGIGVTQTSDTTFLYNASAAYNVNAPLPQQYHVYYTVTSGGCTVTNADVATMTLSNQLFSNLSAQYCKTEHLTGNGSAAYLMEATDAAYANIVSDRDYWNSTGRFYYPPLNTVPLWSLGIYSAGDQVRYNGKLWLSTASFNLSTPGSGSWVELNTYKVDFKGTIRNYYEGYYGPNNLGPTVVNTSATYQPAGAPTTFTKREFLTNIEYLNCTTCDRSAYDYPAFYLDFAAPTQLTTLLQWNASNTYYPTDVVYYPDGHFYRQKKSYNDYPYWTTVPPPSDLTSTWTDLGHYTVSDWHNGQYYYLHGTAAGFYSFGQFVVININPKPNFSGLVSGNLAHPTEFCTVPTPYVLTGTDTTGAVNFEMAYASGGPYSDVSPGLQNDIPAQGRATFTPGVAFGGNPAATATKAFWVRFWVNPGTKGSTNQDCIGYSVPQQINVNTSPTVTFISPTPPSLSPPFCFDAVDKSIKTSYTSTPINTGTVAIAGPGVSDNGNGTATFSPGVGMHARELVLGVPFTYGTREVDYPYVVATVTDNNGCTGTADLKYTVNPLPTQSVSSTPTAINPLYNEIKLCYNDPVNTTLTGANLNSFYTVQYLSPPGPPPPVQTGAVGNSVRDLVFNPKTFYDNAVGQGANPLATLEFAVTYSSFDANGCKNAIAPINIKVSPNFPTSISGVLPSDEFCSNSSIRTITLSPYPADLSGTLTVKLGATTLPPVSIVPAAGQTGAFTFGTPIPGNTPSLQTGPQGGVYTFDYDVVTGANCHNPTHAVVTLLPSPVADFTAPPKCFGDIIPYNGLDNSGNSGASISPVIYTWRFEGIDTLGQVSKHRFTNTGTYTVGFFISYKPSANSNVCTDTLFRDQVVGDIPIVDFDVAGVCKGDATHLSSYPTNGVVISEVGWDFGDGHTLPSTPTNINQSIGAAGDSTTTGLYGNPFHSYTLPQAYAVKLSARSQAQYGSCLATKTRTVTVLNYLKTYEPINPYFMSALNGGDGLWSPEDRRDSSTWVFDVAHKAVIASTSKVWVTNAVGTYKSKDQSYVNSPCLDLSKFTKPSVSINYRYNTDQNKDGAVLQVSLDGGATWGTLGNMTDGLEWYSAQNVSAGPGSPYNLNGFGWSGKDQTDWEVGKHALDVVVGKPGVNKARLRIAFASDALDTLDGFAFNDIRIEERNRTALVENFTNSGAPNFANNNDGFADIDIAEAVKIEYHTPFPGTDNINKSNPGDNDARAAFYGLTNNPNIVPRGYVDGANQPAANNQADFTQNWATNYLPLRSLVNSPLALKITNVLPSDDPNHNHIALKVDMKALNDIPTGRLKLYVGIVEKKLGNMVYVMRKLIPDAGGTPLTVPITKDDSIHSDILTWEVKNIVDKNELAIVAFVQDEITKDVLQSTFLSTLTYVPGDITTGIGDILPEHVSIFPNPADHQLLVELPQVLAHDMPVRLIDQIGHQVYDSDMKAGTYRKSISVSEFSAGLYILQVGSDKGSIVRKKVLIVHEK